MKKIILLSSVAIFALAYEGCGKDKTEALNTLSQSIYVSIDNQFKKNEELQRGLISYFSSSVQNSSTQTSNLTLKNVKFINKNGLICAEISKDEVIKSATETLKELKTFSIDKLPENFKEKQKTIKALLGKISFVKAILNLKEEEISKLNSLEKKLKDLANKGEVTFALNIPYAKISISGEKGTFYPSKAILLNPGHYSYKIIAEGYESAMGEFNIKAGEEKSISESLISKKIMKKVKEKDDYYTKSTELNINYGYAFNGSADKEWDSEKRIDVKIMKNWGIYKLGWGLSAGTKTRWTAKDMNELEILVTGRIQLPQLFDTTFHINKMALIPYFGVEAGWDIYKFIDKSDHKIDDISTIGRGVIGTTILIHKQLGFDIEYKGGFVDKKDNIISAGIVMDF